MFALNTIARKLPLALVASAMLVSLGVGAGSYLIGSQMVGDLTTRNLSALAHERAKQVQGADLVLTTLDRKLVSPTYGFFCFSSEVVKGGHR